MDHLVVHVRAVEAVMLATALFALLAFPLYLRQAYL